MQGDDRVGAVAERRRMRQRSEDQRLTRLYGVVPTFIVEYDHTFSHTLGMARIERVTVTLSAELLDEIDRLERNRSRFIAEAVQHELTRRRRDALLESISSPHPESTELVDAGLADWTFDLPDDEGLVDPKGGTAVRWIDGQGWVREPA